MLVVQNSLLQHQSSGHTFTHTHTHTHTVCFISSSAKQHHADGCAVWRRAGGLASSSCLTEPFIFIVLTFLMFVVHSWLFLMRLSPQISASIFSLFPAAAAISNWSLWGLSPMPYSQLLKWYTRHLTELSMVSPPYTLLRLPWISYCTGAFHSKKYSHHCLPSTCDHICQCTATMLNACDWQWSWWDWTVSLSSG